MYTFEINELLPWVINLANTSPRQFKHVYLPVVTLLALLKQMLWCFIAFFPPPSWWMEDTVRSKKEITPCYCINPATSQPDPDPCVRLGGREPTLSGLFTPCVTMQQRSGHRFRHLSYCVRESTATTSADKLRVVRAVQIPRRSVIDFLGEH